jgi:RNAse (barnase) inhibitor barstar
MTKLKYILFTGLGENLNQLTNSFNCCLSSEVTNKKDLLIDLASKLKFPNYFGFNWDALWDCIRDLSWIKEEEIIIIYNDIPKLEEEIFRIYLKLLIEATFDWESSSEHKLKIVFPEKCKEEIYRIAKDLIIEI